MPGFGPCVLSGHVHRTEDRAAKSLGFVRETPVGVEKGHAACQEPAAWPGLTCRPEPAYRQASGQASLDNRPCLWRVLVTVCGWRWWAFRLITATLSVPLPTTRIRVNESLQTSDEINSHLIGGVGVGERILSTVVADNTEEQDNEETLYRINPDAAADKLNEDDVPLENVDADGCANEVNDEEPLVDDDTDDKEAWVFGWDDEENLGLDEMFREEPTAQAHGINPVNFADSSGDHNRQVPLFDDESDIDSSWDNEDVIEAFESKKVWGRSGLHLGAAMKKNC
ncbi:hypothetical protein PIB30_053838 [Stylosanthes scabra]|uniref:Uncharacterized protein n=1 Tax=Stylosanthes scabra TaxID=79078 RepID=A0ABU6UI28_9FABA|nr:hypothetical protein [Stylosanthes scabra]